MNKNKSSKDKKINVGIAMLPSEIAEMRRVACVDLSGPAVLSLARKGLVAEKQAHPEMFEDRK